MKKVLVSLMSAQTLPNFMLIKDTRFQDVDEYLFINTDFTIKKGIFSNILNALGFLKGDYENIVVKEDSRKDIYEKIDHKNLDHSAKYLINCTGGTKLMSLWTLEYFQTKMKDIEAYYLTFPKPTYQRIFPYGKEEVFTLSHEISLLDYLLCYGVEVDQFVEDVLPPMHTPEELIKLEYEDYKATIRSIRNIDDYGRYYRHNQWFEQYIYEKIKEELNVPDNQIDFNVKFKHSDAEVENEFDVMFIYRNKLHVVEAKVGGFIPKSKGKGLFYSSAYKLVAVKRNFGLFIQGYIFTIEQLRNKNTNQWITSYKKRTDSLNIKLLDGKNIYPDKVKQEIRRLIDPSLTS